MFLSKNSRKKYLMGGGDVRVEIFNAFALERQENLAYVIIQPANRKRKILKNSRKWFSFSLRTENLDRCL